VTNPTSPLIPSKPGAASPYPYKYYRREIKLYRASIAEEDLSPIPSAEEDVTKRQSSFSQQSINREFHLDSLPTTQGLNAEVLSAPSSPWAEFPAHSTKTQNVKSHTTDELYEILSSSGAKITPVSEDQDRDGEDDCIACGLPFSQHVPVGGGLYRINNCALANGKSASECVMCQGRCHGTHLFSSRDEKKGMG
jgi:hypothetical protein